MRSSTMYVYKKSSVLSCAQRHCWKSSAFLCVRCLTTRSVQLELVWYLSISRWVLHLLWSFSLHTCIVHKGVCFYVSADRYVAGCHFPFLGIAGMASHFISVRGLRGFTFFPSLVFAVKCVHTMVVDGVVCTWWVDGQCYWLEPLLFPLWPISVHSFLS